MQIQGFSSFLFNVYALRFGFHYLYTVMSMCPASLSDETFQGQLLPGMVSLGGREHKSLLWDLRAIALVTNIQAEPKSYLSRLNGMVFIFLLFFHYGTQSRANAAALGLVPARGSRAQVPKQRRERGKVGNSLVRSSNLAMSA